MTYHGSEALARELVADLRRRHPAEHIAVYADTETIDGIETLMETVLTRLGGLEILVNNSGPFSAIPFAELPVEEYMRIWHANVTASYLATRRAAPAMREAGWGRVVNLSAVSASVRNRSIYGLAKSAVETLTEELALELGPAITVNAIAPGQIQESLEEMAGINPDWARSVAATTPLRRLVRRSEVAAMVAALCTPAFDMVTGVTIPMDGGLRLPRF